MVNESRRRGQQAPRQLSDDSPLPARRVLACVATMKRRKLLISASLAAGASVLHAAGATARAHSVSCTDITAGNVIVAGLLGHPLGTIVKVSLSFINGDTLRAKGDDGRVRVRIHSVNDKPMTPEVTRPYEDETGEFSEKQVRRKLYFNQPVTLYVYESGQFTGLPGHYGEYRPIPQGYAFHFATSFILLATKPLKQQ